MHRLRSSPAVGNLSVLLDSADGSLDAKYEYGAFGEPLRVGGTSIADDNPFRFSTKFLDKDGTRKREDGDAEGVARRAEEAGAPWALMRQSGLIYYGYRYYSPSLGRFLNRDPIGELGGSNLYAFVENDPVNGWDYLGLDDELVCDPADYSAGLCDDDGPRKRGFFKRLGKFLGGIGKAIGGAGRALGNVARGVGRAAGNIGGTVVGAVGDIGTQIVGTVRNVAAGIFGTGSDKSIYKEHDGTGVQELEEFVVREDQIFDTRKKETGADNGNQNADGNEADDQIVTYILGGGGNAAAVWGGDGNFDIAINIPGGLSNWRKWDLGVIISKAAQAGVNGGGDIHVGELAGSLRDQKGGYLFWALTGGPITYGEIDNQESSVDHYRNQGDFKNPFLSMDTNSWFFGISALVPYGAGVGYGEAEVWSLREKIQTGDGWVDD